jgi:hypothetical protein
MGNKTFSDMETFFLALPVLKRLCIIVGFKHKKFGSNWTECVSDLCNIMCAYDG